MEAKDNMLAKRSAEMALMPPPTKRIKRPTKVLDEDVYSSALSHIIARDFFPGLLEGEAQEEYLSAVESKNPTWIREAGRRMTQVMTPGPDGRRRNTSFTPRRGIDQTPRLSATPMSSNDFAEERIPEVDTNMSLGAFQSKYTSEDNESFNELLDRQNTKRVKRYAHLYQGNGISTRLITSGDTEHKGALIIRNAQGEERQLLAPGRPSQDLDSRPAQMQSFQDRQGPRNAFFFEPDSIEDTLSTVATQAEARSMAPPKRTNYTATRFSVESLAIPPSPSMSAIDAAVDGKPHHAASSVEYNGAETPRVAGYAFVDAEPTPEELGIPINNAEADQAELEAFDRLLPRAEDTGSNPFTIANRSKREDVHARLVDKADVARRKGGRADDLRRLGITPTPRFSSTPKKQGGQMTPAAQKLAAKLATPRKAW